SVARHQKCVKTAHDWDSILRLQGYVRSGRVVKPSQLATEAKTLISTMKLFPYFVLLLPTFVNGGAFTGRRADLGAISKLSRDASLPRKSEAATGVEASLSIPRGGAASLPTMDPKLAAKVFTIIYGINGLHGTLTPRHHIKSYMYKDEPSKAILARIVSLTSVGAATGILFYLQLVKNIPLEKAFGYSLVPMLYNFCTKLVSGEYAKDPLIPAVLTLGSIVAGITESPHASLIIKLYSLGMAVNGLVCFIAPVWSAKEGIYGSPKVDPGKDTFFWVLSGGYQMWYAMALGLPAFWSMDTVTTIGWTTLVISSMLGYVALTDLMPRATLPKGPMFGWIALSCFLALSMLRST
ncbi:MAG: hypothetical protein SGILL_008409, partial [Bacillariaceae sp.]